MKRILLIFLAVLFFLYGCKVSGSVASAFEESSAAGDASTPVGTQELPSVSATASPTETEAVPSVSATALPTETEAVPGESADDVVNVLSKGMENADVTKLQQRLTDLGYMRCSAPSGHYGEETKQAVLLFQRQHGLTEDGIAGKAVLSLIYTEEAQKCQYPLAGYVIGIDPGHQSKGNNGQEPVSPGSSEMKKKVSSGTQGKYSGVPEYQVNLKVGLLLRDLLEAQGATVIMTRETNDVDISNKERAEFFNQYETDYAIRLHCNGSEDAEEYGAFMLVPKENPYLGDCQDAAELLINAYCEETGAKNRGITVRSDQTGFNWCERMIINIEMGYMTNKEEDLLLTDSAYEQKMAQGLCNGILSYFAAKSGD